MNDQHILLVEDDESLQQLIEKLLKNNNYIVSVFQFAWDPRGRTFLDLGCLLHTGNKSYLCRARSVCQELVWSGVEGV